MSRPLVEVQQLLGHASLATTQIYLATRPDQLRTAVAANPLNTQLDPDTPDGPPAGPDSRRLPLPHCPGPPP